MLESQKNPPIRILGIDPGSRITGFGVISMAGNHVTHIAGGSIQAHREKNLPAKLKAIFEGIGRVIDEHHPDEMVAEQVFFHRNAASALKLGQARGAALMAGIARGLPVHEYTPAEIKQAVTGKGNAAKAQVQYMIRLLLNLPEPPESDEADAFAAALCHGHTRQTGIRMARIEKRSCCAASPQRMKQVPV